MRLSDSASEAVLEGMKARGESGCRARRSNLAPSLLSVSTRAAMRLALTAWLLLLCACNGAEAPAQMKLAPTGSAEAAAQPVATPQDAVPPAVALDGTQNPSAVTLLDPGAARIYSRSQRTWIYEAA